MYRATRKTSQALLAVVLLATTACAVHTPEPIDAAHQRALDTLLADLHAAGKISGQWSAQP